MFGMNIHIFKRSLTWLRVFRFQVSLKGAGGNFKGCGVVWCVCVRVRV